jgi:hypothetical protein
MIDPITAPDQLSEDADAKIRNAVRMIIAKATPASQVQGAVGTVLLANFDGVGVALTAGMAGMIEVNFPCRILGCHMYAGIATPIGPQPIAATASVYLGLGAQGSWATGSRTLYANTMPTLSGTAEANVDTTGWVRELQPGNVIPYQLVSFVGSATFLTVALTVRRLDTVGVGAIDMVDVAGAAFTDSNGAEFVVGS